MPLQHSSIPGFAVPTRLRLLPCALQREAYERAGVASAHAIILGSLQAEDLKDADARMLTSLLMVQVGWEGRGLRRNVRSPAHWLYGGARRRSPVGGARRRSPAALLQQPCARCGDAVPR